MRQYLDLLRDVRIHGVKKPTRAVLRSTGEKIDALSVFGRQIRFDLDQGFPLVTTKRLSFNAIVHELIWFLRGSTNIAYLKEHGITIWDEWADAEGELGPVYGKQWRSWQAPSDPTGSDDKNDPKGSHDKNDPKGSGQTIDQIANVIAGIRAVKADPAASVGRRLIVSAWNPAEIESMALPPCHTLFQFSVTEGKLSCQLYQRSADLFLGVPFNIASYALLTSLVAHVTGLVAGEFIHTFGDAHIYANHLDQVDAQLEREPFPLPRVELDPAVSDLARLERDQIKLVGYRSHPALAGEVAVEETRPVTLALIVAMSRDGLIGCDCCRSPAVRLGALPWRLPRDLKHFRQLTWGKPIIMGRKTHEALGRRLPGRTNIVMTRQAGALAKGCLRAGDRTEALALARATGSSEAFIIGGSQVYEAFLPLKPTIHLTLVEGGFTGDVFFPEVLLDSPNWKIVHEEKWPADAENPHDASYMVLMPATGRNG